MLDLKTKEFIAAHRNEDPRRLALQGNRFPGVDMREAVVQVEGWQAARTKLPAWAATDGIVYPPRISMEQCSSEATALYKASLVGGERFADLTGGFGIDCSYMARAFGHATYVERNAQLCRIAQHNFSLLGLGHIEVVNGNSEDVLHSLDGMDWVFIDPARRDDDGRKVVALSDCEPDVTLLEKSLLQKSRHVMVKCSPMLDITAACAQLGCVEEVHVVAVNNECKELLIILGNRACGEIPFHCVNVIPNGQQHFVFDSKAREGMVSYCDAPGRYLYEPNAAIMKAGCHGALSAMLGVEKLHPNSQLYSSDTLARDFPGRIFRVEKVYGFSKAELKEVQALGCANIAVRNFPDTVQQLRKRLRLADGGNRYIFATTLYDGDKVLVVCSKCTV
ncbi:MAG: RsmD family RNA methyltransferase [Bacteroidaceae bacterium]|nr:RsmD family RNA methyltransferase [Bacteroidaceae bacterium]